MTQDNVTELHNVRKRSARTSPIRRYHRVIIFILSTTVRNNNNNNNNQTLILVFFHAHLAIGSHDPLQLRSQYCQQITRASQEMHLHILLFGLSKKVS